MYHIRRSQCYYANTHATYPTQSDRLKVCHNALKCKSGQHTTTGRNLTIYINRNCLSVIVYLVSFTAKSPEKQCNACKMSTATLSKYPLQGGRLSPHSAVHQHSAHLPSVHWGSSLVHTPLSNHPPPRPQRQDQLWFPTTTMAAFSHAFQIEQKEKLHTLRSPL